MIAAACVRKIWVTPQLGLNTLVRARISLEIQNLNLPTPHFPSIRNPQGLFGFLFCDWPNKSS